MFRSSRPKRASVTRSSSRLVDDVRRSKGVAAALALAGLVGGGLAIAGAGSASAATSSAAPTCTPRMLRVTYPGAQGAAGTTYFLLRYTNVSRSTCVMRGYPGLSFTTASGAQLGRSAAWSLPGQGVRTVTLRPGQSAHGSFGLPQALNFPWAACRWTRSTYLRVYPPNSYSSVLIPFRVTVCTTSAGRAAAEPVAAGAGTV